MNSIALLILFSNISYQLELPDGLLTALCYVESSHKVQAVAKHDGNSDSLGVCQIKLETAKMLGFRGTPKQLMDPKVNIKYAGLYLKKQLTRYDFSTKKAVSAYNMGRYVETADGRPANNRYVNKVYKKWRKMD